MNDHLQNPRNPGVPASSDAEILMLVVKALGRRLMTIRKNRTAAENNAMLVAIWDKMAPKKMRNEETTCNEQNVKYWSRYSSVWSSSCQGTCPTFNQQTWKLATKPNMTNSTSNVKHQKMTCSTPFARHLTKDPPSLHRSTRHHGTRLSLKGIKTQNRHFRRMNIQSQGTNRLRDKPLNMPDKKTRYLIPWCR